MGFRTCRTRTQTEPGGQNLSELQPDYWHIGLTFSKYRSPNSPDHIPLYARPGAEIIPRRAIESPLGLTQTDTLPKAIHVDHKPTAAVLQFPEFAATSKNVIRKRTRGNGYLSHKAVSTSNAVSKTDHAATLQNAKRRQSIAPESMEYHETTSLANQNLSHLHNSHLRRRRMWRKFRTSQNAD